jgi:hypothetical protein
MWIEFRTFSGEGPEPQHLPHHSLTVTPGESICVSPERAAELQKAYPGRFYEVDKPAEESTTRFPAPRRKPKPAAKTTDQPDTLDAPPAADPSESKSEEVEVIISE